MEERKLSIPERVAADSVRGKYPQESLSEIQFVNAVCIDLKNDRNFPANTRDAQAFTNFVRQTGLDFDWPVKNRLMVLNEALRHGRMRCDRDPGTARFLLRIVEVRE
jgi:hypothetical protein